jgi:flagellar biosynthetic protein FliQ
MLDQGMAVDIARQGMEVALMVTLPILAVTLFVGVLVSVFQAITQVQEMTLTFVPKLLGVAAVLVVMGTWMLTTLVAFTHRCFEMMGRVGG